jgi:exodeoxyribonuclease III
MPLKICTWNINSARPREPIVLQLLKEEVPEVLCLQEARSSVEKVPLAGFRALGYEHVILRGEKGYNGVAILSRLPSGTLPHDFHVPAGGGVDRTAHSKFGHKRDFLEEMRCRRHGTVARPHLGDPRSRGALGRHPHRPARARQGEAERLCPRLCRLRGASR